MIHPLSSIETIVLAGPCVKGSASPLEDSGTLDPEPGQNKSAPMNSKDKTHQKETIPAEPRVFSKASNRPVRMTAIGRPFPLENVGEIGSIQISRTPTCTELHKVEFIKSAHGSPAIPI